MPDTNQQQNTPAIPMVLVKKPDGTTERVPLDKVMKMKKDTQPPNHPTTQPQRFEAGSRKPNRPKKMEVRSEKQETAIASVGEEGLSTTTPVKDVSKDRAVSENRKQKTENSDQKAKDLSVKKSSPPAFSKDTPKKAAPPVPKKREERTRKSLSPMPSVPTDAPKTAPPPPAPVAPKKPAPPVQKPIKKKDEKKEEPLSTTTPVKDASENRKQKTENKKLDPTDIPSAPPVAKNENTKQTTSVAPQKRMEEKKKSIPPVSPEKKVVEKVGEKKKVEVQEPIPKKNKSGSTDFSSLLEESLDESAQSDDLPVLPSSRDDVFDRVTASLAFTIPKDLVGRAQSLVQSRLKEVRSDDQVKDYASRPVSEGGLGLSEDNASVLLGAIQGVTRGSVSPAPKKIPAPAPAPAASEKKIMSKMPAPKTTGRPVLHDVVPPVPQTQTQKTVGPIDELRFMVLVDFRRLAGDVTQAKQLLLQKFETLKEESYLQYLKGRSAWFTSPLYMQYKEIIAQSINRGETIDIVLQTSEIQEKLSKEEFLLIAEVNKHLNI